ncbi:MAG: MBL fold metallo-hydrolase [Lachnospiraceae bacterium]|nr:MBL fold metallo-hydrolase [Lachnospiraceae bacterium]
MNLEWHGNASFSITSGTLSILFDPFVELPGGENPNCPEDFSGFRNIFLTHGHVDHLGNLPDILAASDAAGGRARLFCTETPCETLRDKGVNDGRIRVVKRGDVLHFYENCFTHVRLRGTSSEDNNEYVRLRSVSSEDSYAHAQVPSIGVTVLAGQHIHFDRKLLLHTFLTPHLFSNPRNLLWIMREFVLDPENGETVAYKIETEGKTILLLGSLGLHPDETYPSPVDALILPYQGASDLITPGLAAVDAVKPGMVIMSHFDDAFPPISRSIDPAGFIEAMGKAYPGTPVVVPGAGVPFCL